MSDSVNFNHKDQSLGRSQTVDKAKGSWPHEGETEEERLGHRKKYFWHYQEGDNSKKRVREKWRQEGNDQKREKKRGFTSKV